MFHLVSTFKQKLASIALVGGKVSSSGSVHLIRVLATQFRWGKHSIYESWSINRARASQKENLNICQSLSWFHHTAVAIPSYSIHSPVWGSEGLRSNGRGHRQLPMLHASPVAFLNSYGGWQMYGLPVHCVCWNSCFQARLYNHVGFVAIRGACTPWGTDQRWHWPAGSCKVQHLQLLGEAVLWPAVRASSVAGCPSLCFFFSGPWGPTCSSNHFSNA